MRGADRETVFRPGDRFLRFSIVRLIGRGGIAEVYEILLSGKRYALKVLQRRFSHDLLQMKRAQQEAWFLIQVRNPNLVDVQETGIDEGVFWMRMELIHGMDLREAIHRLGPMSVNLVYAWLSQAAYGAHQCHLFGIIHRDIKPENIMLTPPDTAKLTDLGLALVTAAGMGTLDQGVENAPKGTAPYMSPEQARGENLLTPASDVYALIMVGYEMLMGEHPFLRDGMTYDYWSMIHKQVHERVPPLASYGFPEDLSRFFERGLSKAWQDRPENGLALVNELRPIWRRYVEAHPDEDPNPGEPAIAWLLDGGDAPPSFGTGPMSARRTGTRPSKPAMPGPRASHAPPSSSRRPILRFQTEVLPRGQRDPSAIVALGPRVTAAPQARDTEPDPATIPSVVDPLDAPPTMPLERDTDPDAVPLPIRRFETISLPPALRDPEAIRALAPYREAQRPVRSALPERRPAQAPGPPPRVAPPRPVPRPPAPSESTFSTTVRSVLKVRRAPPAQLEGAGPPKDVAAGLRRAALILSLVAVAAVLVRWMVGQMHRTAVQEPTAPALVVSAAEDPSAAPKAADTSSARATAAPPPPEASVAVPAPSAPAPVRPSAPRTPQGKPAPIKSVAPPPTGTRPPLTDIF